MIRPVFRALAVVLTALGLAVGFVPSASASADGPTTCWTGVCVWFHSYGDIIYVEDTASNGRSAVAQVYIPDQGVADNLWNTDGYGSVAAYSYSWVPEGTTVYYRACDGTSPLDCNSGWTHGTA